MKRTILVIKIKMPSGRVKTIENKKATGWTDKNIKQYMKGVRKSLEIAFPGATITTSTISEKG